MSSEDTLHYAEREEESANIIQHEINREEAEVEGLQKDIAAKTQVISSLKVKKEQHVRDAKRLREQYQAEDQQEKQHQKQKDDEGMLKKAAKEALRRGLI